MRGVPRLVPWLACLALSGCASAPRARQRTDSTHAAIVMSVTFRGRQFPYWRRHCADELFFSRVDAAGELDPVLLPANLAGDCLLYVLDVPPGRYAPVAASYFTGRTRQLARFDDKLARDWAVDVKPGTLAFGGVGEIGRGFGGWGSFLLNGVRRAVSYLPPFKRAVVAIETTGVPRLDKGPSAELDLLRRARSDLKGTEWTEIAAARLTALGDPPPVLFEGLLRNRPLPTRDGGRFSYVDILDWGDPRPLDGGLEWSQPGGGAWISVRFVARDDPGFRPISEELAELKAAGSPEDSHQVSDVMVSSRTAHAVRYTTYVYPNASLLGSEVSVFKTEALVVPALRGYYKMQLRAEAPQFASRRRQFARFLEYLSFAEAQERRR